MPEISMEENQLRFEITRIKFTTGEVTKPRNVGELVSLILDKSLR
jgi:hypothetical protein